MKEKAIFKKKKKKNENWLYSGSWNPFIHSSVKLLIMNVILIRSVRLFLVWVMIFVEFIYRMFIIKECYFLKDDNLRFEPNGEFRFSSLPLRNRHYQVHFRKSLLISLALLSR